MGQETIDIVVKEGGADKAAANIRGIGTAADSSSAAVDKLNTTMTAASGGAAKMQQAAQGVAASAESEAAAHGKAAAAVVNHAHGLEQGAVAAEQLRGILVSLGLALGIEQWVKLTDAYTTNINQLRQVTHSAEEYAKVQARLKQLSDETFSSVDTNTRLFVGLSQASRDLRLNQDQLFNIVHVLNDSLRESGSNSQMAAASIQALSVSLQTGTVSARTILPLLHEMPSLVAALADKFNYFGPAGTANFIKSLENGTISVKQVVTAIAGLDNTLQGGVRNLQQSAGAYDKHGQAVYSDYEKTLIAKGELLDYSQAQKNADKVVLDYSNTTKKATAAVAESGVVMNKVAAGFTNVLPTITDGWTRIKNAIYTYVGAQDRMTGASDKAAQALIFIADNAHVMFGAITILSASLVAYTAAANAARIVTFLFGASFSWAGLAVAAIAAAAAAVLAFGNDIRLTADGSITLMGAVVAVLHIVRDGFVDLWHVVGQGSGAWGQAALAVVGFGIVLRIVTGIDAAKWLLSLAIRLGEVAVAAVAAAGPWGVVAAAIVTAGVAAAYFSGKLDGLIDSIKSTLGPAIDYVKGKATEMTQEFTKSSIAVDEFGKKNNEVWPDIIRGVGQAQGAIQNMTDYTNAGLGKMAAVMDNTTSTMNTDFSSIASGANSASASLTNLMNAQNSVNTAASNFHLQPGQSAYGGSTKGGIVWNNSGILTSHDLNPGSHFASGGSFMVGGQGGTDSQVVKFMASPDERVTVETPAQQQAKSKQGGNVVTVPISMTVVAKDAASFNNNRQQIVMGLSSELSRALRNIGNGS